MSGPCRAHSSLPVAVDSAGLVTTLLCVPSPLGCHQALDKPLFLPYALGLPTLSTGIGDYAMHSPGRRRSHARTGWLSYVPARHTFPSPHRFVAAPRPFRAGPFPHPVPSPARKGLCRVAFAALVPGRGSSPRSGSSGPLRGRSAWGPLVACEGWLGGGWRVAPSRCIGAAPCLFVWRDHLAQETMPPPCRRFFPAHPHLLGTPPVKVREPFVSAWRIEICHEAPGRGWGKTQLSGGLKSAIHPDPLADFAPHKGHAAVVATPHNCSTDAALSPHGVSAGG
jgi:hypothetical protein